MKRIIILLAVFTFNIHAQSLNEVKNLMGEGNLFRALELIDKVKTSKSNKNSIKGKIYLALQDYEKSLSFFTRKDVTKDSKYFYELGLCYYNLNELGEAKTNLRRYVNSNKKDAEAYYLLGDILKLQGSPKTAKGYFNNVLKLNSANDQLKQASLFQLSEMKEEMIRTKKGNKAQKRYALKQVIPNYQRALHYDEDSALASEIITRLNSLSQKYRIAGQRVKRHSVWGNVKQEVGFDSNILLIPDDVTGAQAENKSGAVSKTSTSVSYAYRRKSFEISPNINLGFDRFFDRSNTQIYKNDEYRINGGLKTSLNHKVSGKTAKLSLDLTYKLTEKDYLSQKDFLFYSRKYGVSLGEQFNLFKIGPSSVKVKYERTYLYSKLLDSSKYSLNISQVIKRKNGVTYISLIGYDQKKTRNELYNADSYYLTGIYKNKNLLTFSKNLTFKTGLTMLFIDYENQSVRGLEKNLSPFVGIDKRLSKKLFLDGKYSFTKNLSDEDNYDYSRHYVSLGISYKF
ncbi:MAG: hypothetical protein GY909_03555 [Oligoflexia bacterium]|nr:hypothetical protein [Oligoflexia bacterium]